MDFSFENGCWEKEGNGEFLLMKDAAEIRNSDGAMSRIKYTFPIENNGQTLKFSVDLCTKGVRSNLSAYAVVSQKRADGKGIIRAYAVNEDQSGDKKSFVFKLREECTHIMVELGLKSEGEVCFSVPVLDEAIPVPKRPVRIVCPKIIYGETKEIQMNKISDMIDKASAEQPDLIVFSEQLNTIGTGLSVVEKAETVEGAYCTMLSEKARKYSTYIVANFTEKDHKGYYNTSVLIGRDGTLQGRYHKTHLAFGEYESGITPGSEHEIFETDFGKIGLLVCWDAYFPEPARLLAKRGAELLVISTVGDPGFRHVSRALENGVYVAVAGSQFQNLNDKRIGASKIIAPTGEILSEVNDYGVYAFSEIDLSDKMAIPWLSFETEGIPDNVYMNERRPDIYGDICF